MAIRDPRKVPKPKFRVRLELVSSGERIISEDDALAIQADMTAAAARLEKIINLYNWPAINCAKVMLGDVYDKMGGRAPRTQKSSPDR